MKTNLFIKNILLASLLSSTVMMSCKKTVEVKPYSVFDVGNFFKTVDEAKMATLGIYAAVVSPGGYAYNVPLVYDYDTDQGFIAPGNTQNFRIVSKYLYLPNVDMFYQTWTAFYQGVDRANLVIERIPEMELYSNGTADQKAQLDRMLGEAKFLRGFYYSELVRLWGDVPFKTKSSTAGDNPKTPLTDRKVIYAQVIKDIKEAIEVLPATLPVDERINKFGAKAVLARVLLFAGGFSLRANGTMQRDADYLEYYREAQIQVDDVIGSGLYRLNPVYSQPYKNQSAQIFDPQENLFEISIYTPTATGSQQSSWGTFNIPTTAAGVYAAGLVRTFAPAPFLASFAEGDLRRDFSIAQYSINAQGNRIIAASSREDEQWKPGKWSREWQKTTTTEPNYTNINPVIMRYADVLLMKAEIDNEINNGPTLAGLEALNKVRRRAFGIDELGSSLTITLANGGSGYTNNTGLKISFVGGGGTDAYAMGTAFTAATGSISAIRVTNPGHGYTSVPTVTVTTADGKGTGLALNVALAPKPTAQDIEIGTGKTKEEFLELVQDERNWELCFEGVRRGDLIRWNILGDKIKETQDACKAIRSNYAYDAATNFIKNKHELYPFPQNEKDANSAITRQNPGF